MLGFVVAAALVIAFVLGYSLAPRAPAGGPYHGYVVVSAIPGGVWLRWSGIAMRQVCEYPYNVTAHSDAPVIVNVTVTTNRTFLVDGVPTWSQSDVVFYELKPSQTVVYPSSAEMPGDNYTSPSQCPAWTLSVAAYYVSA